ncbi:MAG: glycosyltransferase [Alphaproteobacteria bacterium]|jgi:glycosyltransferase involved in cell wall biosynthesis|nr:glycosyltransferase [Alphaproteobacteria bacterium]
MFSTNLIKVSLIVPFYNVGKYFEDCIKSLINQDMLDMEIILVNNCSTDGSLSIAEKYAKVDSRIKIIHNKINKMAGGGRNTGLLQAVGEYIWFIDSDDYISENPNTVQKLYNEAHNINADWLMFDIYNNNHIKGSSIIKDANLMEDLSIFNDNESIANILANFYFTHGIWKIFFKTGFLIKNECYFLENNKLEDYVSPLWLLKGNIAGYLQQPFYVYRKRENSITTTSLNLRDLPDYREILRQIVQWIDINNHASTSIGIRQLFKALFFKVGVSLLFNESSEDIKIKMIEEIIITIKEISFIFKSPYFTEENNIIKVAGTCSKEDLSKLVNALKDIENTDNLRTVLYQHYLKLGYNAEIINSNNRISQLSSDIIRLSHDLNELQTKRQKDRKFRVYTKILASLLVISLVCIILF